MGTSNVGNVQWRQEAGRRRREQGYGFTNDAQEYARLTLQHHLMKLAWHSHYWSPIHNPEQILDVACGTGIWGYELLQQFPHAHLTALDIDSVLSRRFLEKEQAKAYLPLLSNFEAEGLRAGFLMNFHRVLFQPQDQHPGMAEEAAGFSSREAGTCLLDKDQPKQHI